MSDETTTPATVETVPSIMKRERKLKLTFDGSTNPVKKMKKGKSDDEPIVAASELKQWTRIPDGLKMVLPLSEGRSIRVTTNLIVLEDEVRVKFVSFNFQKLSKIMAAVDEVDGAIEKMKNYEDCNLRINIGGNWYLTITTGVKCVDIRRWFLVGENYRPSRNGMALRLAEWQVFKCQVKTIHQYRPDIAAVIPCYRQEDHNNQFG